MTGSSSPFIGINPRVLQARRDVDGVLWRASVVLVLVAAAGLLAGELLAGGVALTVTGTTLVLTLLPLALLGMLSLGLPLGAVCVAAAHDREGGVDGVLRRDALLAAVVLAAAGVGLALLPAGSSVVGGLALAAASAVAGGFVGFMQADRTGSGPPPVSWVMWAVGLVALMGSAALGLPAGDPDPGGLVVAAALLLGVPLSAGVVAWRLRSVPRVDRAEVAALGDRVEGATTLAATGAWDEALSLVAAEPEPPWWGRAVLADALVGVAVEQHATARLEPLLPWVSGATAVDAAYDMRDDDLAVRALAAALGRGGMDAEVVRARIWTHDWRRLHRLDAFEELATEHHLEQEPVYGS